MRPRSETRPEHSRENEREEKAQGAENEEPRCGGVSGDRRVGTRLPYKGCGGDNSTRQTHREHRLEEGFRSSDQNQSAEEGDEYAQKDKSRHEALVSSGDPEIPYPPVAPEQEDVPSHEGSRDELSTYVKSSLLQARSLERHESVERREDKEWVQGVREEASRTPVRSCRIHEE